MRFHRVVAAAFPSYDYDCNAGALASPATESGPVRPLRGSAEPGEAQAWSLAGASVTRGNARGDEEGQSARAHALPHWASPWAAR